MTASPDHVGEAAQSHGGTDSTSVEVAPARPHYPAPLPLTIPRGLVMLTALWVFAAWLLLFGTTPPVQAQAASYGPTIQMLFTIIGAGIGVAWPLLRLSGRPSAAPLLQSLVDALAIAVLLQVVIWPLRLVTTWSIERTTAVDLAIASSTLTTGCLLSLFTGSMISRTRTVGMACFVLAAGLPAAAFALFGYHARDMNADPAGLADFLRIVPSAPMLIAQFAAPLPLDPTGEERGLLAAALWLASGAGALALGSAVVRRVRANREAGWGR